MRATGNLVGKLMLASAVSILAGCGGEPSASDIEAAYKKLLATETFVSMKVEYVKKIGCKEDGKNAFRCDVDRHLSGKGFLDLKGPQQIRVVKTGDGWSLVLPNI